MPSLEHDETTVRFSYAKPGTRPPIYLAGSFTSPPWEAREMSYVERPSKDAPGVTECDFYADVSLPEGTWQYKFRIGPGDWWGLDERADTVTDEAGNVNNVIVVRAEQIKPVRPSPVQPDKGKARVSPAYLELPSHDEDVAIVSTDEDSPPPYEEHTYTFDDPSSENMQTPRPLPTGQNPFFDDADVNRLTTAFAEALGPDPDLDEVRPEHAPLFAHECLSSCDGDASSIASHSPSSPYQDAHAGPEEADLAFDDETPLEMFPSDGPHIFEYIAETESRLEEDVTSDDDSRVSSPVLMPGTPVDTVFSRRLSPPNDHSPLLENIPEENVPELDDETSERMTLEDHGGMAMNSDEAVLINPAQPKSARSALDGSSHLSASLGGVAGPNLDRLQSSGIW